MNIPKNAADRTPEQLEAGALALDEVAERLERRASTGTDLSEWWHGVEAGRGNAAAQLRAEADHLRDLARTNRER